MKLLIVDDEKGVVNSLRREFKGKFEVFTALNGEAALEILRREKDMAVIISDQRMPGMSGVEFLEKTLKIAPHAIRLFLTAYADMEASIEAVNKGKIFYYIRKPWETEEILWIVKTAAEKYRLEEENRRLTKELIEANERLERENFALRTTVASEADFSNMLTGDPEMSRLFKMAEKVLQTDTTVLILGETGTGKELLAKAIHYNSPRGERMFIAQNCAAIPETLLESELFGHVKGAFTGAVNNKKGLFELAEGGTVFLDEIGETTPDFQVKILRLLQEKEYRPVGGNRTKKTDVRIIAATNKDLKKLVEKGLFREDLYYRLNVFPLRLPPLRERKGDIALLAKHFVGEFSRKNGKNINGISKKALELLNGYSFPGNIRELRNIIERAAILASDGGEITPDDLIIPEDNAFPDLSAVTDRTTIREQVKKLEKKMIEERLRITKWNLSKAAKSLGISRQTLYQKMDEYGIE